VRAIRDLANVPIHGLIRDEDTDSRDLAEQFSFAGLHPFDPGLANLLEALSPNPTNQENPMTATAEDTALNRLRELTGEVVSITSTLKPNLGEFGDDGGELFSYIEDSGAAIQDKLGEIADQAALADHELRHDFRNMIGSVTGFSELILMEPSLSPSSQEGFNRLRANSKEFVQILDDQKSVG
ncbi:MAG: hypothetical protein AAF226_03900, partial [Verrucomicrobiota bacterium]